MCFLDCFVWFKNKVYSQSSDVGCVAEDFLVGWRNSVLVYKITQQSMIIECVYLCILCQNELLIL